MDTSNRTSFASQNSPSNDIIVVYDDRDCDEFSPPDKVQKKNPIECQNRQLNAKIDQLMSENVKLLKEGNQWRQRANALAEQLKKNPEDSQRPPNEYENMKKLLTTEKEKNEQLQTELTSIRQDKSHLEAESIKLVNSNQTLIEEKRQLSEEISKLEQSNSRASLGVIETEEKLLQLNHEMKKMAEELAAKRVLVANYRDREIQIQKLAKKYKDDYIKLQNSVRQDIVPLQEKNHDWNAQVDELKAENAKLRQQTNTPAGESIQDSEDFIRLQSERENLAKTLSAEKEKNERFEAEMASMRQEKTQLENEMATLAKSKQTLAEENQELSESIASWEQINDRVSQEIVEIKNESLQRENRMKNMTEDMAAKDALVAQYRNREDQIRKIAKKYKDGFLELQNKFEQEIFPLQEKNDELNMTVTSLTSENAKLLQKLATTTKSNQKATEELQCLAEKCLNLKESNDRMSFEALKVKKKLAQRDGEAKELAEELAAKSALLTNSQNKAIQLQKVAKKYKDGCFKLQGQFQQEIVPLLEMNRELNAKIDKLESANAKVQHQTIQQSNASSEQPNEHPEDLQMQQNERECLVKMLNIEREKTERLASELKSVREDVSRFDAEMVKLTQSNRVFIEDKRTLAEGILILKQSNDRVTCEITEIRKMLMQRDDEVKKLTEDMVKTKGALLADKRDKECQIRQIAKKFKYSPNETQN